MPLNEQICGTKLEYHDVDYLHMSVERKNNNGLEENIFM